MADKIFSENEDFTLDLLKKDYYYGLFNSGFDFYLPDEFVNKFKNLKFFARFNYKIELYSNIYQLRIQIIAWYYII